MEILPLILANFALVLASWGATISMFLWSRKEANDFHRQTINLIQSIQEEMKDFHGRLCAIEERKKK